MPAPKPSLTPYTPGYPVRTGRNRMVGGRADFTLHAYASGGLYLIGTAYAAVEGWAGSIVPVVTWADAPETGWYYINWDDWTTTTNVPDTSGRDSHASGSSNNVQLAWMIEVQEPVTSGGVTGIKTHVLLKKICQGSWNSSFSMWELPASASASGTWSIVSRFPVVETVEIAEHASAWPDGAREEGMHYLSAAFRDTAEASYSSGDLTFNGASYTISPNFGGADPLAAGCQLQLTSIIGAGVAAYDPSDYMNMSSGSGALWINYASGGTADYTKRLCGTGSIGSSESPMWLPRFADDSDFKRYRLWDKWNGSYSADDSGAYECELIAEGDTVSWYACGKTSPGVDGGGGRLIWTRYAWAYRLNVTVQYMDGETPAAEPVFVDHSTPVDGLGVGWTGGTSPIRSGGGLWRLEGQSERAISGTPVALIPDPPYATHAARLADPDGNPNNNDADAYNGYFTRDEDWSDWHIGPFELVNPEDFGGYSDQTRVLLRYPRQGHALTVAMAGVMIDAMAATDWTAHNCTITAEGGGGLRVTNVTAGAYITRGHTPPIHAPAQRYWQLVESCYAAGTATPATSNVRLSVEGTGYDNAGAVNWEKRFTHRLRGLYWDTCRPEEAYGHDLEQSYISQAQPEHEDGENSVISWGWGVGLFSTITIENLETGKDYVFSSLQSVKLTDDKDSDPLGAVHQSALMVAHEYSPLRLLGTVSAVPDDDRYEVERIAQASVNGRIGWEAGAIYQSTTHPGGETLISRENLPVKGIDDGTARWPADGLLSVQVTDEIGWSDGWWDAGSSEYIDESVLFCGEVAPAWFLTDGIHGDGELDVRPLYDQVSVGPHYGSGANIHTDARPACIELFATLIFGNRMHGALWKDRETAEETDADKGFDVTASNDAEGYETSAIGSWFSNHHGSPSTVEFDTVSQAVTMARPNVWTRLCMFVPGEAPEGAPGIDVAINLLTGTGYMAYVRDGKLYARRSLDWFATAEPEVEISDTGTCEDPCVVTFEDSQARWGVMWRDGEDLRIAYSADGWATTSTAILGVTGMKYARAIANGLTGTMLLVAWTDDGDLVSRTSRDFGKTFAAEVTVASGVPEQAFGLAVAPDARDIYTVVFQAADDNISTYWSGDDGASWSDAATV